MGVDVGGGHSKCYPRHSLYVRLDGGLVCFLSILYGFCVKGLVPRVVVTKIPSLRGHKQCLL